ncbi:HAD-IA family hydrolase [Roseovarius salis]|uniref:HAD family hydrolase n=1 Tax=Roseovarius salis TaxID=3376063 RepID=UPI0037C6C470
MVNEPVRKVDALLFDKDGTLFDFHATWSVWAEDLIAALAEGCPARAASLAAAIGFDPGARRFLPTSPVIAGTNREAAECVARVIRDRSIADLEEELARASAEAPLTPPVPLGPLLDGLRGQGLVLGVVTNDSAFAAAAHLRAAGIAERFSFVAGFDSGHGAKPAPGALLAFARAEGLDPRRVAMVGDSTHDLIAGRAAGMIPLGVLTGPAGHDELSPHADAVLPDIGHVPAWLSA